MNYKYHNGHIWFRCKVCDCVISRDEQSWRAIGKPGEAICYECDLDSDVIALIALANPAVAVA